MLEPIEARVPVRTPRLERLPQTHEGAAVGVQPGVLLARLGQALAQLVERLEDPARMLRLSRLELEGSLMAVTRNIRQAARKVRDAGEAAVLQAAAERDWLLKADLALAHDRDDLARLAVGQRLLASERRLAAEEAKASFEQEVADLGAEAERLRGAIAEVWMRQRSLAEPFAERVGAPDDRRVDDELKSLKAARLTRAN